MPRDQVSLRLDLQNGSKTDGSPKIQAKTFSTVNQEATDEELLEGGKALAGLLAKPTLAYKKVEITKLGQAEG